MQQNQIEALVKVANAEYPLAPQETNLLKIATVVEKRASMLQSLLAWAQQNPELATTALGTLAGGGLGALFSGRDEETGETHRGRNALLGALLGGGSGALAGYYGKGKIQQYLGDWLSKLQQENLTINGQKVPMSSKKDIDKMVAEAPDTETNPAAIMEKIRNSGQLGGDGTIKVDPKVLAQMQAQQLAAAKAGQRDELSQVAEFEELARDYADDAPDYSLNAENSLRAAAKEMGINPNSERFLRLRNLYYGKAPENSFGNYNALRLGLPFFDARGAELAQKKIEATPPAIWGPNSANTGSKIGVR